MRSRLVPWLVVIVVLAGCGEAGDGGPTLEPIPAQLAFTLPALDGGVVEGADLAGRHLALWFWTPW